MLNTLLHPAYLKARFVDFAFEPSLAKKFLVILALALGGAFATAQLGVLGIPVAGAILLIVLILLNGTRIWLKVLTFLLMGYLFLSKGFATIGFYPVYIGEGMLCVGILTLLIAPFIKNVKFYFKPFKHWEIGVLFLFLFWQIAQTVPYFKTYQFDTLRDAMQYGYAAFALLAMLFISKKDVQGFFDLFGRIIPYALLWFPVLFIFARVGNFPITFPGAQNPIIYTKGSDVGVHLAGFGAMMLLQLDQRNRKVPRWLTWVSWLLWSIDVVLMGAMGRGIMVAVGAAAAIVILIQPMRTRWYRPLLLVVVIVCLLMITGLYSAKIDLGLARNISVEQLMANVTSIVGQGDNSAGGLEGTKEWRLRWWNTIIDYTFHGRYFWTGKGYGINLADSDGFQVQADDSLRSPHNGHMTFLARSGVPGFVLWVVFLVGVVLRLLRNALDFRHNPIRARYALWLLAYLTAFLIMTGLDVFLEGPMGGIWFWALIGFIYVYLSPEKKEKTALAPAASAALAIVRGS